MDMGPSFGGGLKYPPAAVCPSEASEGESTFTLEEENSLTGGLAMGGPCLCRTVGVSGVFVDFGLFVVSFCRRREQTLHHKIAMTTTTTAPATPPAMGPTEIEDPDFCAFGEMPVGALVG